MMKKNIIINGNSIEEMNRMEPNSVDLIFADPPYWMRVEGVLKRIEGTDFNGCNDEWDQFNTWLMFQSAYSYKVRTPEIFTTTLLFRLNPRTRIEDDKK